MCVPLIVHGDDAECHRRRSFTVCSFASVTVGKCSPWENRFLLYCMDGNKCCDETLHGLDTWLMWSFNELMTGTWTDVGPFGETLANRTSRRGLPLAGGYCGILVFHRGDEKYMVKSFNMRVSWVSEQVCWRCRASRVPTSNDLYTFHGPAAPHRQTFIGLSDFITQTCRDNPWVHMPGFDPSIICYDLLHVFDLTLVADCSASAS